MRRTKIVATLGPATDQPGVLDRMIETGVDVFRLNFSHGEASDHVERAKEVRSRAQAHSRTIGVMADIQGPKLRIGKFAEGEVELAEGQQFILDTFTELGDENRVGVTYKRLPDDVERGATLLLNDGLVAIWVEEVRGQEIIGRVVKGGTLSDNKGLNRAGGGLTAQALTEKDRQDIKTVAEIGADYLAVSFPRGAEDMDKARELLEKAGGHARLLAKIERPEAVDNIDEIIAASDAIMVARGDLGLEIGDAAVPPVQKRIIRKARQANKAVITATQMMESMTHSPIPTRAEVSDVANAVLDGTDAVMLSGETANGDYPVEACGAMDRVCRETERSAFEEAGNALTGFGTETAETVDESIAQAALGMANKLEIAAIAAFTTSGRTALWMSRGGTRAPIYALSPDQRTRRQVTMYRGVYPISFPVDPEKHTPRELIVSAESELRRQGAVREGDLMILTLGEPLGKQGSTNTIKVVKVGETVQ
ncbi:MAG TPA: pyruvate kinase [Gammaproteobacteria bacterium]|nr:pyruvate kinase [Gammaproteobacteria bacterium]